MGEAEQHTGGKVGDDTFCDAGSNPAGAAKGRTMTATIMNSIAIIIEGLSITVMCRG